MLQFVREVPSSGLYYTTATMEMRSSHGEGLSNQIYTVEHILSAGDKEENGPLEATGTWIRGPCKSWQ